MGKLLLYSVIMYRQGDALIGSLRSNLCTDARKRKLQDMGRQLSTRNGCSGVEEGTYNQPAPHLVRFLVPHTSIHSAKGSAK